jgi:hypothetical protein
MFHCGSCAFLLDMGEKRKLRNSCYAVRSGIASILAGNAASRWFQRVEMAETIEGMAAISVRNIIEKMILYPI